MCELDGEMHLQSNAPVVLEEGDGHFNVKMLVIKPE